MLSKILYIYYGATVVTAFSNRRHVGGILSHSIVTS